MYRTVLKSTLLALVAAPDLLFVQAAAATSSAATATQSAWGQCGGTGWTGATVCVKDWTCTYLNEFYSQCLQSTATSSTKATSSAVKSTSSSTKPTTSSTKPTTSSTKPTTSSTTLKPSSSSTSTPKPTSTTTSTTSNPLNGTRTTDIFATITGIYGLPGKDEVLQNATLKTDNIQCDILVGMRKKLELFLFFEIEDVPTFKKYFHAYVVPKITSVTQVLSVSTQPLVALNVAFAQRGLYKLGVNDNVLDKPYTQGQAADAYNLGDPGTTNWVPQFASGKIDGVFLIASDDQTLIDAFKNWLLTTLTPTGITDLYELQGHIRPAPYDGHEMFGYLDGIGQPAVAGFNINPLPGQQVINAGVILDGEVGDTLASQRPPWMFDGSFLAFRQLKQLVPEFDKFLLDKAPAFPGYTQQQNADLLGARIIGRWKSGTPVDVSPYSDNGIGSDPFQNNDFDYDHPPANILTDQSNCPFAAHTRKTRPRADENTPLNAIMRGGIPYGPEVTSSEAATNKTSPDYERGLAFVGYQSQIAMGFQFIQTQWANDVNFAAGKSPQPGYDVVFGQNNGGARWISGTDPNNFAWVLPFPTEFVISRGGEYFFSPSINALANTISV